MFLIYTTLLACTDDKQEVVLPLRMAPDITKATDVAPIDEPDSVTPTSTSAPEPPTIDGCQATHVWQQKAPQPTSGVTVTAKVETAQIINELLVDFLLSDGEVTYGIKCPSNTISVDIPANLGTVRLAVFVDNDRNGPSKSDLQGVSQPISITTNAVSVPPISLSETPVPLFNFAEE